jgi:putative hemolysin
VELEIGLAVLILIALVFLATVDMAFSTISDVGLRRITSDEESADARNSVKFLRDVLDNRPRFRFAISSTIQVLLITYTVLLTVIVSNYAPDRTRLFTAALMVGLVSTVLFRQIIPRLVVRKQPEHKLLLLIPAIRPIYAVFSLFLEPLASSRSARLQNRLERTVAPDTPDDRDDDNGSEDFQALMEVGEAEGIIEEDERKLIETVVELGETRASEIMTPRTEMCVLPLDSTVRAARDLIVDQKYSRVPVYRDSIDNIEGIIYVRDLLQAWADGREDDPIGGFVRDAFFVPETKTAEELLRTMQANHVQCAVVIDEYGGVAGLITVEDIVEEIVGEIEDEDSEEEEIIEIVEGTDGYYDVLGSTDIDKIERLFDLDLEDEDYTTIAGLVTSEIGHVPKDGEKLELRGLSIEVLRADEKKLHLLRLRLAQAEVEASGRGVDSLQT